MRTVLIITALMSAAFGVQVVIDMLRPRIPGYAGQPLIGWLGQGDPGWWEKASFWSFVASLPIALFICLIGWERARWIPEQARFERVTRLWQASAAGVLLLPFVYNSLDLLAANYRYTLICIPAVAYALFMLHRMQRYRKMPVRLLIAMCAWGAIIGLGFGYALESWFEDYASYFYYSVWSNGGQSAYPTYLNDIMTGNLVVAGIFEEIGKGVGVAIVFLLLRREIDNVVSGIVLGAATGVGFNLVETVSYMGANNGQDASTQYFLRQSLGMMAAHVAFTAAIGAGFGIARQIADPNRRRLAVFCGFGVAMAGHFANDVLMTYYGRVKVNWFEPSNTADMLIYTPLAFLVLQGPLVMLYLVLLRRGLKDQAAALSIELRAEAATGFGAIEAYEIPTLLRPWRRFRLRAKALSNGGVSEWTALGRLYNTQLELGMARWHTMRGERDPHGPGDQQLRQRIAELKYRRPRPTPTTNAHVMQGAS
jgi:RsiW-degrading membrane proteinase PrsW (M82 family)